MKIEVLFLTGKLGGYNAMKPLLELINSSKSFNLNIAVTDQHLIKKFGYTYNRIKKDFGTKIVFKIFSNQTRDEQEFCNFKILKKFLPLLKEKNRLSVTLW